METPDGRSSHVTADRVCVLYRPLVEATVRRLKVPDPSFDDGVQEGMIGLLAAYRRYDPSSPVVFGVFARSYVKGAIIRGVFTRTALREVPNPAPPNVDALAQIPSRFEDGVLDRVSIGAWIAGLAPRDAWVIRRVFWDDASSREVAAEIGVTERRVNQRLSALLREGRTVAA